MRPITDRLSPVIKFLVIADALVYAYYVVVRESREFFQQHLAVGGRFWAGELWQLVTSLFVHIDPISFFFNIIGLWWVGATIEHQVGTRRFLTIFFVTGLVSDTVLVLLSGPGGGQPLSAGCGSSVLALYIAFGTIMDRTPARILGSLVLEARTFMAILIGYVVVVDLSTGSLALLASHVSAMLLGHVLVGGRGRGIKALWGTLRAKRARRRYQVLEGGRRGGKPQDLN
jgi:membrane associated rhomboid family serine protease